MKLQRQLFTEIAIRNRVAELARCLSSEYTKTGVTEVVALVVLKGAFVFAADLIRQMFVSVRVEFVQVRSYEDATSPQHAPSVQYLFNSSIFSGKHLLIIEDIVDSGNTLVALLDSLPIEPPFFPLSLKVCALLEKEVFREGILDGFHWLMENHYHVGFRIPNEFVVGYGLDHAGLYRDLADIRVLEGEENAS